MIKEIGVLLFNKDLLVLSSGTKSPNTTVNIFSKSDPTLTDLDQVTDMNKNDSNEEAMFKRRDKTDNLQNSFSVDDDTNQNNNNNNNMNVLSKYEMFSLFKIILTDLLITLALYLQLIRNYCFCVCLRIIVICVNCPRDRYQYDYHDGLVDLLVIHRFDEIINPLYPNL